MTPSHERDRYGNLNLLTGRRAIGPVGKNFCHATIFSVICKRFYGSVRVALKKHPDFSCFST